jgi:LacI family transcriptional regulator
MARRSGIARLRDVAEAASVSVATVSRYLNHTLSLPADTAGRINAAIGRLNYRPNPHARRLSLGRAETIGLVIPDVANPFFAQLADAVEQAASEQGLGVLLCATRNRPERELDYLARMRRNFVDGLLFLTNHRDDGPLARAINAGGEVVLLDEDIAAARVPKVFADNERGGRLAGQRLLQAGHRRLGFIGGPAGMLSSMERLGGLRAAVREAGPDAAVAFESLGPYTIEQGRVAAEALLAELDPPTAVFAASDELALGLLQVLARRGVAVPEQMSLIAFDDVGPLDLLRPALTAVRQPVAAMGREGVGLLLAHLRGEAVPAVPRRLPVELVDRASVAEPAGARGTGWTTKQRRASR